MKKKKLPLDVESFKEIIKNGFLKQDGMEIIHQYGIACYKKTCKVVLT